MRILLSGASSFTGYWFSKKLVEMGHEVRTLFQRASISEYADIRKVRVEELVKLTSVSFSTSFGSERFLELLGQERWDVYCHHGFQVGNYRSDDFDVLAAAADNVRNLRMALATMAGRSCLNLVFTGTVFETGEGVGSEGLPSITNYGLSKSLTWQLFRFEASRFGIKLSKFVIPNPFGPYEEARFTHYLMSQWCKGAVGQVRTPDYVRDNIPVDLLALDYVDFVKRQESQNGPLRRNSSGFIGSQADFSMKMAAAVRLRTGWDCELDILSQTDFSEPRIRVNSEPALARHASWNEQAFWDDFVSHYQKRLQQ